MTLADRQDNNDRVNADRPADYRAIDYRAVRRAIPLSRVLELLEFHPTRSRGRNLRGRCVLCSSASPDRSAKQTRPCFAADLSRDIWHCFGCHQGGDQLTLWSLANHKPLYAATKFLCQSTGLPIPRRT
jgi:DNA primase